jgi:hypothetical protein
MRTECCLAGDWPQGGIAGKWKLCVYKCIGANSLVFVLWPRHWPCPGIDPISNLIPTPFGKSYTPGMADPPSIPFPTDLYSFAVKCPDYA